VVLDILEYGMVYMDYIIIVLVYNVLVP